MNTKLSSTLFGQFDGLPVTLYTLENANGMKVELLNYGGIIKSIYVPDQHGKFEDVVLGFDNLQEYIDDDASFGAFVGRYANRITNAQFDLDGKTYHLAQNIGGHTLHGGRIGFAKKWWDAETHFDEHSVSLTIKGRSEDGDESFPGNLDILVQYLLTNNNELHISYTAQSDQATVINLTNHAYFNLRGEGNGSILDHLVQINAKAIVEVNADVVPTGQFRKVGNSAFDFRKPTKINDGINDEGNDQIRFGSGYDHTFVLDSIDSLKEAAQVTDPHTGRRLIVLTDEPSVHLYCGNWLDMPNGKNGHHYKNRSAFCLETQHFPDSPNQPHFPSTRLDPGQVFTSKTIYKFDVEEQEIT